MEETSKFILYYYIIFFMLNSFFFSCVFLVVVDEIHHELSLLRFLCVSDIHECVIKTRKSTSFLLSNLFEREKENVVASAHGKFIVVNWKKGNNIHESTHMIRYHWEIYMLMKKANKELWFYGYRSFREWSSIISYVDVKCFVVGSPNEHMHQIWPIYSNFISNWVTIRLI